MRIITFSVPGTPVGKGRARFNRTTRRPYTPQKTRNFEEIVRAHAANALRGEPVPVYGAVSLHVIAEREIPRSRAKKVKPGDYNLCRPDWDNIGKIVSDALNKVIWNDDSQIVEATVEKRYGDMPGLTITVLIH